MKMIEKAIKQEEDAVSLRVEVFPNSSASVIKGFNRWRNTIQVALKSPAKRNMANGELLKFISDTLGVSQEFIYIVKGARCRRKTLLVVGLNWQKAKAMLESTMESE